MNHALNWLLRCFGITKWSRNWSKLAGKQVACRWTATRRLATSRLENYPKPESKRLVAWSRVWCIFFASSSSFVIFLHLFFLSPKPWNTCIFTSNFFIFHPFSCPNQSFKLKPMHLIFINHFSIIFSSLVLHSFLFLSHVWIVLFHFLSQISSSFTHFLVKINHSNHYSSITPSIFTLKTTFHWLPT